MSYLTNTKTPKKTASVAFNEDQKNAMRVIHEVPITLITGQAGVGKSLVAIHTALKMLKDKTVDKIIFTRPAVSTEELGFLPGTLDDKYLVYLKPLIEFMDAHSLDDFAKLRAMNKVDYTPLAFIRGVTFERTVAILDEAQNTTPEQMKAFLTRIGQGSKLIITGDTEQCDLNPRKVPVNGLQALQQLRHHVDGIEEVELTICERNPIIDSILKGWALINTTEPIRTNTTE